MILVASAQQRGVPLISAQQLLDWLDGRNSSTIYNIAWNCSTLTFSVSAGVGRSSRHGGNVMRNFWALVHQAPFGIPSGWSTYEQSLSEAIQSIR